MDKITFNYDVVISTFNLITVDINCILKYLDQVESFYKNILNDGTWASSTRDELNTIYDKFKQNKNNYESVANNVKKFMDQVVINYKTTEANMK